MKTPAVSILLAVRNEQTYLPAALRSLQRQTLTDWELIAVDDGSSDSTPEILEQAATIDARIKVVTTPARGLVQALNLGLQQCRAPLVARMDGDDICHPARLAAQLGLLEKHPQLTLVASRVRHFPRPQLQEGMRAYENWQNSLLNHAEISRNLFVESPFAHPSVMYRKADVLGAGGYREQPWAEDYDLWLRLAAWGASFTRHPDTLLFWRDRPERLTRTAANCSLDSFRRCKAFFLETGFLCDEKEVRLWGAGLEGKAWRKILTTAGIEVSSWIEIDPRKIGQRIHQAPVLAPEDISRSGPKILITVGSKGARPLIRDWCDQHGFVEGRDYLCVT